MFHANEACDGKGTLTVKDGSMTIHVSLASKSIVNLFYGLAEDAQKDGAELLQPTTDTVTYSDGLSDEVYGFDIPVPALDTEFDVALIGKKGVWYDHKVSVTDPVPAAEAGKTVHGPRPGRRRLHGRAHIRGRLRQGAGPFALHPDRAGRRGHRRDRLEQQQV